MSSAARFDVSLLSDNFDNIQFYSDTLQTGVVLDLYNHMKSGNYQVTHLCHWIGKLTNISVSGINPVALVSKIHRTIKIARDKRREEKTHFLEKIFLIPQKDPDSSVKPSTSSEEKRTTETETSVREEEKLKAIVKERRRKVKDLSEQNKQLKRKLERRESRESLCAEKVRKVQEDVTAKDRLLKELTRQSKNDKIKSERFYKLYMKSKAEVVTLKQTVEDTKFELRSVERKLEQDQDEEREQEIARLKVKVDAQDSNVKFLESLLNEDSELQLFDETEGRYTNQTVECVMGLTDLRVASEKVGEVIKCVATLCGKTPNSVPTARTVNRIVDSKVAVAHAQVAQMLEGEEDTTLYTDETRKYGKTVETYLITDSDQNSYLLGLREMFSKSAKCTLDTFKEILADITDCCHLKEGGDMKNIGYRILANIKDTMSDRASTEKAFNKLLEEYRSSILGEVIDGWGEMTDQEREACSKMNNFFCGLHLLVGMADVCEAALRKFESMFAGGEEKGSGAVPELKRFHKAESGTLRLIRTCCKAFAVGEDEKNGASLEWKTYLKQKSEKGERNLITRFKHNRFNLVFLLGKAIYFHSDDINVFLNSVIGKPNSLLRAVALDIQEPLFLACIRAFGLISQYISAPLWRILESPGHILDMNETYHKLVVFLERASESLVVTEKFIRGEETPFDVFAGEDDDKVSKHLNSDNAEVDSILYPILQSLFKSVHELLCRMIPEHLPGGIYWYPSEATRKQTRSVKKHNKLPEFTFGQLDQLLKVRPNATTLTNESFLLFSFNKTRAWLAGLQEDEKTRLLNESRMKGTQIRQMFRERMDVIERNRVERQKSKQQELERKETERLKKAENMTGDICYYGLWQSEEQVNEGLARLESDSDKRKALEAQIRFRKSVLMQKHHEKKIFNFSKKLPSGKYEKLSIQQMRTNVLTLITSTLDKPTVESQRQGIPLLVGKTIDHQFSDQKYRGKVISVVPGFPTWYNVQYDNDAAIYAYNLADDYSKGDLEIVV